MLVSLYKTGAITLTSLQLVESADGGLLSKYTIPQCYRSES